MRVSEWALWRLPRTLLGYVLAVDLAGIVLVALVLYRTDFRLGQFGVAALLLCCAIVNIEALRRIGEPAGISSDLQAAWTLPMAMLLPPVFGLLSPALLNTIQQFRVNRAVPYRRFFSSAAIGLANLGAAVVFRALIGATDLTGAVSAKQFLTHPIEYMLAAAAAGIAAAAVNFGLVLLAVKLSAPATELRDLLLDPERLILNSVEICSGLVVTFLAAVNSVVVVVVLPPMVLLQRSIFHGQLNAAARLDGKTGLLNAATWNREAEQAIAAGHNGRKPVSLLLIDLDHFKLVNDRHGHLVGDEVLKLVAEVLAGEVRKADLAGRFGGEEFVLLLADTTRVEAGRTAERLRTRIAGMTVEGADAEPVGTTVSIGVAVQGHDGTDLMELLAAADTALYRAKNAGRNRTWMANDAR